MPFPEPRFSAPPRSDAVERGFSAAAFALLLTSWVIAYTALAPAEPFHHWPLRLDASRVVVADGRVRP